MKNIKLTQNEAKFLTTWLETNECGAENALDLIDDNFSCHTVESIMLETGMSFQQVGGFISSLESKGILWVEERRQERLPDLYWIDVDFLELLDKMGNGNKPFKEAIKEVI